MITAEHIDDSIARALRGESHLDPAVLDILGFATPTMRHMFSNLCHIDHLIYLEVGPYAGATFCAALSNNSIHAIGIDNFSQTWHEGRDISAEFHANLSRFGVGHRSINFFKSDCFMDLLGGWPKPRGIDIFYFDGDHTREAQTRALPHFFDALAETFLFIVDDYNWPDVANGTLDGFKTMDDRIEHLQGWALSGEIGQDDPIWHNGIALFLCKKT